MLRIGPSGNSTSFYASGHKHTYEAPAWLKEIGLTAYEYSFGRGITLKDDGARRIGEEAKKYDIEVSVHAPYYINFAKDRIKCIQKIFDFLEVEDSRLRTCHNGQIFSHKVLCSLMEFMKSKNLTFCDLLLIAPFEFTWYNAYFQKTSLIREVAVEPFFKMYHTKSEYILDRLSGNRISNLKSQYIGYILNSNWSKGELRFKNRGILDRILYLFLTKFT